MASLPAFNSITPPLVDLETGLPEVSDRKAIGGEVTISPEAVRDPAYAFEGLRTDHPDAVAERRRLQQARARDVSHYVVRRWQRWERVGFDRVEDDITLTTVIETGSDVELTTENKRQVSEKLRLEVGYADIVKLEGEISQTLEFNNSGVFKTSNRRTETVEMRRTGGHLYVHWQIVETIEILRVRRGRQTNDGEPIATIVGRGALVTRKQPLEPMDRSEETGDVQSI